MADFHIDTGGITRCSKAWGGGGWRTEPMHKLYQVREGRAVYALPGQELRLEPGRIYLLPRGRPHRFGGAEGLLVAWLHFLPRSPAVERCLAEDPRIRTWPEEAWAWWRPAWDAIPAWLAARELPGELRLQALLAAACAEAVAEAPAAPLDPRLASALAWMEANCLARPGLAAAARVAGLAPAVFQRRFSAAVGRSPRAWLEDRRLDHAVRLLRQDLPVQEAAAACGYPNPFHFSRVLRRRLGASPQELRRRWAGGGP